MESATPDETPAPTPLADTLREGVISSYADAPGGGGHPGKFKAIFDDGTEAIVKPAVDDQTHRQANNEEAAWVIADALDMGAQVGVTVQRELPDPQGKTVEASLQKVWPGDADFVPDRASFSDDEAWSTAAFDHIVRHQDRNGNNWIATNDDDGSRRLRLVDHGHAFGFPGDARSSEWADAKAGQQVPEALKKRISTFIEDTSAQSKLQELLGPELAQAVLDRAAALLQDGAMPS